MRLLDVANVSHEIRSIAFAVCHLLVNVMVPENLVDSPQHSRNVLMYEDDTSMIRLIHRKTPQRNLGHVDRAYRDAFVHISDQRLCNFDTNGTLRLFRAATN